MYKDSYYSSAESVSATTLQDRHADSPALTSTQNKLYYPGAERKYIALLSLISSRWGKFNSLEFIQIMYSNATENIKSLHYKDEAVPSQVSLSDQSSQERWRCRPGEVRKQKCRVDIWKEGTELCILCGVHTLHNTHSSVSTHSRHQPAATWVNTTRYCKYSQELRMMGENIARNMQSRLGIIN